ncbi:MAG: ASPIC/UnbV domain-containing protein, partial [Saprospiraceae bacterium]|nr:ASPIC/UnbV domain-containing protein [Saprospiraceae bacterium]
FQEIFVTNTPNGGGGGTRLLYNNGDGTFSDISSEAGAHIPLYTWAGLWLDFDNDTDQDLFVATLRDTDPFLWLKNFSVELGLDVFLNPWPAGLPGGNQAAFSAAYFDYNNDGLLDIVTPNGAPSPIQVWENITVNNNNWVMFDLEGVYSTRDAVGARVEVFLGEQRYIRYLTLGDCYLTQNHKKLHFGLGAATNIDSVVIRWLSGITETYENVGVNQIHSFVEGNSFELSANMETLDPSCFGAEDGSVSVSPVGGTGPFAFSWNNGETLPTLAGLSAGRYIVTLTDANGQQGIAFTDLVDPAPVVVAINATNDSGLGDGMVSAVVSGGSGTYDYQWSNGSDLAEITNLTDGIYTLNVLDELGCGTSGYGVVYNEMGPCAAYIPTDIEIGLTGAVFYWSEVPNRENYRFAYRESGTLPWFTTDGIINDPYVAIDKLDPGFTYDYKTKTNCIGGEKSDWSDVYSFTTNIDGPDLCQAWEVSSVYVDNNSAFLFFDDQPDATAYRLRYRALGAPNWLKVTTTYSLITLDPLASGTTFEYQTATRCTLGWTEWSGSEIFETEGSLLSPELSGVANTPELIVVADMLLFPNPTQDILNVAVRNGQPLKMIIQDASGREQLVQNLSSSGIHVNLSGMESGIYFMTIILEDGQILNERFIKQ